MLEVMSNHPEGIRSVILDSPLIPGARWDEMSVENYWTSFHNIFEVCRNDSILNSAFPDLERRFLELIDEAYRNPIAVVVEHPFTKNNVTVELDGEGLFLCAAHFIENGQHIYGFPYSMNLLCNCNMQMLAFMASELVSIPSYAWGMRYSIWCKDVFPFEDFEKFICHGKVPPQLSSITWTVIPPEIYDLWPRNDVNPDFIKPVTSEIPVLVTNGQYDPDTPPEWGKELCKTPPNSHYFLFPGQSHLPLFLHASGKQIAMAFLEDPYKRPDERGITENPFKFYSGR
jgi:pimeloyl-ACP methyl ester carboxylesterase